MSHHQINAGEIIDWDSFHDVFMKEFNFPDYYGRNMDAWIDCMSDLKEHENIVCIEIIGSNLDLTH